MTKEQKRKYLIMYAICIPPIIMSTMFEKKLGYFLPFYENWFLNL